MTLPEKVLRGDAAIRLIDHELDYGRHLRSDGETLVRLTPGDLISIRVALCLGRTAILAREGAAHQLAKEICETERRNEPHL